MAILSLRNSSLLILVAAFSIFQNIHVNGMECGSVNLTRSLMRGGRATLRNEWPFIVALYEVRHTKFICGGTLISNRHVLTGDYEFLLITKPITIK